MLTYKSNAQSVVLNISNKLKSIQNTDKLLREVANGFYSENLRRVHNEGKDTDNKLIGEAQYSTTPIYISVDASPKRITPKGKSGKTKFKNGNSHKSAFFQEGYKGFRTAIGRTTSVVNLQLSGKLKTSWAIQNNGKKWLIGFDSTYGKDISEGLEEKYNQEIWGVSEAGRQLAIDITTRWINENMNGKS